MSAQDFSFTLDMAGAPEDDESKTSTRELLSDLVARVLERVGAAGDAAAGITDAILRALMNGSDTREPCRLQFEVRNGRLRIVVSSRAGEIWQTTREIPRNR